jgi:aerotaxis receptor
VNQAVSHLDDPTQRNAALVEQAAVTAKRLAKWRRCWRKR